MDKSHYNGDVSLSLAAFWGMKAPKELPTLPGTGGDGTLYTQFDPPSIFWNSKYIESLKVKKIVLDEEDKSTSTSNKIHGGLFQRKKQLKMNRRVGHLKDQRLRLLSHHLPQREL